jgi:hypothetical protein
VKVLILDGLGRPVTLAATRVIVTTDSGTPVAFSVELMPTLIDSSNADDENFNARLRAHGIDRSVQVDTVRAPRIDDFEFHV